MKRSSESRLNSKKNTRSDRRANRSSDIQLNTYTANATLSKISRHGRQYSDI